MTPPWEFTKREWIILDALCRTAGSMPPEIAEALARGYGVPVARIRQQERALLETVRRMAR